MTDVRLLRKRNPMNAPATAPTKAPPTTHSSGDGWLLLLLLLLLLVAVDDIFL
jgi:hypothetical protein